MTVIITKILKLLTSLYYLSFSFFKIKNSVLNLYNCIFFFKEFHGCLILIKVEHGNLLLLNALQCHAFHKNK